MADMYYDEIADGYNGLYKEEQLKKLKLVLGNIEINKTDRILDVGCGTNFCLERIDCAYKIGIDPSERLVAQSKEKAIVGKAEALPFADKEFDWVISLTALQNFDDISLGLDEIKRVGKNFVLTFLKRSPKAEQIKRLISQKFKIKKKIEEEKDLIYVLG